METNILRFEHPEYLYLLLVIPIFIALYILLRIINKRQFKKFADSKFAEFLVPLASKSRSNTKFVILIFDKSIKSKYGIVSYRFQ